MELKKKHRIFLDKAKDDLKSHGISVYFSKGDNVNFSDDHTRVSGYWDDDKKHIAVGTGHKEWITSFAHEYCHFRQWAEKCETFVRNAKCKGILWEWINGKEFEDHIVINEIETTKDLELDCERRTVKLIKYYGLVDDIERYIKEAASYIYYYNFLYDFRKWIPSSYPPDSIPEIVRNMPTTLRGQFKNVPQKIDDLYRKYYS